MRDHLKIVRNYLDKFLPKANEAQTLIAEDDRIAKPKAKANNRLKIQELEASSRVLKNIQEIGRHAVSEPLGGVRVFLTEIKEDTFKDANALRAQVERLQKRLKDRAKQIQQLETEN